jgi:hypothetical protein
MARHGVVARGIGPARRCGAAPGYSAEARMAIEWLHDADAAKSAALKQRKPIFIDVYKDQ